MRTILGLFMVFFLLSFVGSDIEKGTATYYGNGFNGRRTSSGEIFQNHLMTAAHKTLPFGTMVKVTNVKNDSVAIVKINDRLPKSSSRIIDLTMAAAKKLNFVRAGVASVTVEVLTTKNEDTKKH
ncbi:MAG: septal ring lytic transglycosylase RlpA family protein [Crocinitomicaceae bacterium]